MHKLSFVIVLIFISFLGCESKPKESKTPNIVDNANIIAYDKKTLQMYEDFNKELLDSFDIDFRTVTTINDEDINVFSNKIFNKMQKNSRSKSGKALLLVVNPVQDKVRLEVSMGLEHIYTDAFVSYIQRDGMVPYFKDDKVSDGVYMVTELIRDRANEARSGKEFVARDTSLSAGGGAKVEANIGKADKNAKKGKNVKSNLSDTPKIVLEKYLTALKNHNKNPNLEIFTKKTQDFFKTNTSTDINQDNEVRFITPCMSSKKTLYSYSGDYAVMANDFVNQKTCTPYFFKKEDGRWKLDIFTMANSIRFNVDMLWHFDLQNRLKDDGMYYAFAFDGYGIDKNGYIFKSNWTNPDNLRWGFMCGEWFDPKDRDVVASNPKKYIKCYIAQLWYGSLAITRLGLSGSDSIYAVGEGTARIENVSYLDFMAYMKNIPTGSIATIEVKPINSDKIVIKRGVAP